MKARSSLLIVAAAVTLLASVILLASEPRLFSQDIYVSGDAAADELLLDKGRHEPLLYGHYSRFNFNHPGPFFFDVRLVGEHIVGSLFPGPYNAHAATLMVVNAAFIGVAAATAFALAGGGMAGWLAALGIASAVMFQFHDTVHGPTSSWMPDALYMPYLTFLLSLMAMGRGSLLGLIAATFCGGALVHGYVVMPAFVAPPFVAALVICLIVRWRTGKPMPWAALAGSAAIVLAFIAPILADALLHPPGNIGLILDYMKESAAFPREPNLDSDVIDGLVEHWSTIKLVLWVFPALALLFDLRHPRKLLAWIWPLTVLTLSTVLFAAYLKKVPPPLYDFIGYFHESVPLALIAWGMVRLAAYAARWKITTAAALIACIAGSAFGGGHALYPQAREVRDVTFAILQRQPEDMVVLRMGEFHRWSLLTGVMFDLGRFGIDSCTTSLFPGIPEQSVTQRHLCPHDHPDKQHYVLTAPGECGPNCLLSTPMGDLAPDDDGPIPEGPRHIQFGDPRTRNLLGPGWSVTEPWGLWSDGGKAELHLDPALLGKGGGTLMFDMNYFLAGQIVETDVPVSINGSKRAVWHFDATNNQTIRLLDIRADDLKPETLVVRFDELGKQTPAMAGVSGDQRHLGLALRSLVIVRKKAD